MEPNKIEKEFRKQLHQREIAPSASAWDRLDAMLTVAEEKKPKPKYSWLYVAASIVGFVAIVAVFFNSTQELVDVKHHEVVEVNATPILPKDSIRKENQTAIPLLRKSEIVANNSQEIHKKINNQPTVNTNPKTTITSNQNPINLNQNPIANQPHSKSIINQKTEQLTSNPIYIANEAPVVMTESKLEPEKATIRVNASSLLSEVDGELELSFREKVIKRVDKNFKTVKVALANRNQQSTNINQN